MVDSKDSTAEVDNMTVHTEENMLNLVLEGDTAGQIVGSRMHTPRPMLACPWSLPTASGIPE